MASVISSLVPSADGNAPETTTEKTRSPSDEFVTKIDGDGDDEGDGVCSYPNGDTTVHIQSETTRTFRIFTTVYQMKVEDYDPLKVMELIDQCRHALRTNNHWGSLKWNEKKEIVLSQGYPMEYLETEHIRDFEEAQERFMAAYWSVHNSLLESEKRVEEEKTKELAPLSAARKKRRGLRRSATREESTDLLKEEDSRTMRRTGSPLFWRGASSGSSGNDSDGSRVSIRAGLVGRKAGRGIGPRAA